jgi:hypothetical protein
LAIVAQLADALIRRAFNAAGELLFLQTELILSLNCCLSTTNPGFSLSFTTPVPKNEHPRPNPCAHQYLGNVEHW